MKKSFTLIEVLVAITIFAFLSVSFYALLRMGLTVRKRVEMGTVDSAAIYLRLERMAKEMRNNLFFKPEDSGFSGTSRSLSFYSVLFDYANDQPKVINITYNFEGDALRKSLKPVFGEDCRSYDFIENLDDFVFSYYNPEDEQWQQAWNNKEVLPQAVKIELTCRDEQGSPADFSKHIFLHNQ